jgi:ribosomal protein S20
MPIIKSAKKRVRVAEKAAIRNSKTKRAMKTALKAFGVAVAGGAATAAVLHERHAAATSNVDKATKKNLIHKNKAARIKSKLARDAKAAATAEKPKTAKQAAPKAATKSPAKKPAASKSATAKKPTAAKKPAAKKAAAKKPAAKK